MVHLKGGEGDPDGDLRFWKWSLDVIQRLKADGMSSDESGGEDQIGERIYRVKIMVWRRRIEDLIQHIDRGRRDVGIYSLRGSTGCKRLRAPPGPYPQDWPETSRNPLESLPYVFYDEDWFQRVSADVRQASLHVTREEFEWFQMYGIA